MSQVRVGEKTHKLLHLLSSQEKTSMQEILEKAVEDYRRKTFLDGLSDDFQSLQQDPEAWEEYEKEIELWNNTLMDGLEEA